MDYRVVEGSTFTAAAEFLDDSGAPLTPAVGYPKVKVLDNEKDSLGTFPAYPDTTKPGTWSASVSLPTIGLKKLTEFRLRWELKEANGNRHKAYDLLFVAPKVEDRKNEIVALYDSPVIDFVLPFRYSHAKTGSCKAVIYSQNNLVVDSFDLDETDADEETGIEESLDSSSVVIANPKLAPSLAPDLLVVTAKLDGRTKTYTYRFWTVTPQILVAANMLESFLNKAQLENVIASLRYTDADLISYLERGLYLFNMTGYPTAFNGTNMQGALLDSWVICATYWAIGSQLIAEGSLSFDFNGQGVSFNVDRTPQLDSALGRIESRIQDTVLPLKKKLAAQNIISGDGSAGAGTLRNVLSTGVLSLTNAATTRVRGMSPFIGRRF